MTLRERMARAMMAERDRICGNPCGVMRIGGSGCLSGGVVDRAGRLGGWSGAARHYREYLTRCSPARDDAAVAPENLPLAMYRTQLDQLFSQLVTKWLQDTNWLSSINAITNHPSFYQLVQMGLPAVERILERMTIGDIHIHWFPVLITITGTNAGAANPGRPRMMAADWIRWGRESGLIS